MRTIAPELLSSTVGGHRSVTAALSAYAALSRKIATAALDYNYEKNEVRNEAKATLMGAQLERLRGEAGTLVDWIVSRAK